MNSSSILRNSQCRIAIERDPPRLCKPVGYGTPEASRHRGDEKNQKSSRSMSMRGREAKRSGAKRLGGWTGGGQGRRKGGRWEREIERIPRFPEEVISVASKSVSPDVRKLPDVPAHPPEPIGIPPSGHPRHSIRGWKPARRLHRRGGERSFSADSPPPHSAARPKEQHPPAIPSRPATPNPRRTSSLLSIFTSRPARSVIGRLTEQSFNPRLSSPRRRPSARRHEE